MGIWERLRGHASNLQLAAEGGLAAFVVAIWISILFSNGDAMIIAIAASLAVAFSGVAAFIAPQITVASKWGLFALCASLTMAESYFVYEHYLTSESLPALTKADLDEALSQAPRVVITDVEPLFTSATDVLRFNASYANQGQGAVAGLKGNFALLRSGGTLSRAAEDQIFAGFYGSPVGSSDDLMQPGTSLFMTFPSELQHPHSITIDQLKVLQKSQKVLYLTIVLNYFEPSKPDTIWHTEFCQYYDFRVPPELVDHVAPHTCSAHNGITSSKRS